MKIRLITFTDYKMTRAADVCRRSALQNNIDEVKVYTPEDIHKSYKEKYSDILDKPRGAGYWLWKPYFIYQELFNKNVADGDILVYCDAGVEIVNNIRHIIDRMDQDIFLFANTYNHYHWCKMDVIKAIVKKGVQEKITNQVQASVIVMKVSDASREFVKEWARWCEKPGFITDEPSSIPNHPEFKEHRHDQAILTCVAYQAGIKLHWWPAMYNAGIFTYEHNGYDDSYPVIFHHHRIRDDQFLMPLGINRTIINYFRQKRYI